VNKDKKPLSETHPDLAKEAFGWDPNNVVAGINKNMQWKCEKNHLFVSSVVNRSKKNGTGCPICSNLKVLPGFNDLATTHPDLAKEASGWDPKTVVSGSSKKFDWKCAMGHVFISSVNKRKMGTNCPFCAHKKILPGFNDLATTHPDLAKEASGWDPKTVIAGSDLKLEWQCSKGHVWISRSADRKSGYGCPYCSNQRVLSGFNDLATTHPDLAKEASGWDPKTVIAGTSKKFNWKCSKGHVWESVVSSRAGIDNKGCPYCSNQKVLPGFNDLATTHPDLAKEASGWDPKTVIAGTNKKLNWKCLKGHTWMAVGNGRINGNGCPYCANKKVMPGFNDLATTHPDLAKEAFGWDPKLVSFGSVTKTKWKCKKDHVWIGSPNNRSRGNTCPYCANKKVMPGFNDLATTHPDLAKEASGWDPKTIIGGTHQKLGWKCSKGHLWIAEVKSRVHGNGCPSCAVTGFDPNKDAYLYFLIQPFWEIYQIGITNVPEDRLNRHSKNGFELLELRGPMDGHTAHELETAILRYLKNQKADLSPEHIAGKFDGYSESWTIDSYKINNLKELIDKASEAGF